jgi:hypothetical protein
MGRVPFRKNNCFFLLLLVILPLKLLYPQDKIDMDQFYAEQELRFGVYAFHEGAYNRALLSFEKSLSFKPDFQTAEEWLARTYYHNGQTSTALDIWSRLLEREVLGAADRTMISTIRYRRELLDEGEPAPKYVEFHSLRGSEGDVLLFKRPTSVVPDTDGGFYVVSFAGNEVVKFSLNGTLRRSLRGGLEGLNHPFDMTVNPKLGLFITEFSGDRIVHCTPDGRVLSRFGGTGTGEGQLLGPQYITDDGKGYLYVTDQGNGRVSKFDYEGNFILTFGDGPGAPERLDQPTGILAADDLVYVADKQRAAILVYDESGNFIRSVTSSYLEQPEGLSLYSEGKILVAEEKEVLIFDVELEVFSPIAIPDGISAKVLSAARDVNDNLLLADFNQDRVSMLADFSRMYSGLFVKINQVNSDSFPKIYLDLSVERRDGSPFVGLEQENFYLTEGRYAVDDMLLEGAVDRSRFTELALLVEKSETMRGEIESISRMVTQLTDELLPQGSVHVVQAGRQPILQAEASTNPQEIRAAALRGDFSSDWSFDQALRLAVSPLLSGGERRAVLFLNSGTLPEDAFESYELIHLLDYMVHNDVAFYSVSTDPRGKTAPEIEYLCERTGGKHMYLYNPEGLAPLVEHMRHRFSGRYILSYRTTLNSDFGRNYLPVEAQVSVFGRSGRSELGYFGPPETD